MSLWLVENSQRTRNRGLWSSMRLSWFPTWCYLPFDGRPSGVARAGGQASRRHDRKRPCLSAGHVGDDHVHRNVVGLRIDRRDPAFGIAYADRRMASSASPQASCRRSRRHSRADSCAASKPTTGAMTISGWTDGPREGTRMFQTPRSSGSPGDQTRYSSGQPFLMTTGRAIRAPRSIALNRPVAQVGLAAERPVGADHAAADLADRLVERGGNAARAVPAHVSLDGQARVDQSAALGLAPPGHFGPGVGTHRRDPIFGHEFMHVTWRGRIFAKLGLRVVAAGHRQAPLWTGSSALVREEGCSPKKKKANGIKC